MAFNINDRVKETTATTGTGAVLLLGAVAGFQSFSSGVGTGNNTYYTIVEDGLNPQWEVGNGSFSGSTLTRDTVYSSSNNNNLVVFTSGIKSVYVDLPASQVGLDVNAVLVPSPPDFVNNNAALGVDLVVTGSNIRSNVRRADVAGVADEEIGLLIGAPANRVQISGGNEPEQVLIPTFSTPPTLIVTVQGSATAIATQLTNAGRFTLSSAITGGATLVASGFSSAGLANNQVTCAFSGATIAQIQAIFAPGGNRLRSDQVFAGTATEGQFVFTQNNGNPRQAIGSLMAGSASVTITRDPTTNINTFTAVSTGGTPAGSNSQIQFNNNGAFGASAGLTWLGTSGLQLGTVATPAPLMVGNAAVPTAITPGTLGQVLTSSVTGTYWATSPTGVTTLQQLTDVAITEPVFAQVGTATVVSISAGTTSIVVTSAAGIAVGDWLRGGTVMPGQVPALQVISIAGTLIEFNLDPTPFFAVGNFIYRLPENLEGARLSFSNAQNKWISSASLNFLPMDTISWVSLAGDPYVSVSGSPIVVAPITTNSQNLASPWTFGIATLGNFPSPSEVCGVDALGRQVTGQYVSAAQAGTLTAILEAIKFDRVSGGSFVINNTYPLTWRQGTFALPDYVRFNTTTNAITQGQTAVDLRTAALTGVNANPATSTYTNAGVSSPASYGGGGTTWTVNTLASYNLAVAAMTAAGATPPAVQPGNWTLPSTTIYISNIAAPTATQFGTITNIGTNPTNNVLVITLTGNVSYFGNQSGGQPLFYLLGKYTFVTPPQTEIIRLANVNDVASLNALKGDVTIAAGTGIGIVTSGQNITVSNTGSSSVASSNFTSFVNDQFPTPIAFVSTSSGTGYANELYVGMGWQTDTEAIDGGFIGNTKYIGTVQTTPTTPGNGLIYPVAATYNTLEVIVNSPGWSCTFTTSNSSAPTDYTLEGIIFAKKTSDAANPPILAAQIFPGFQVAASDDVRMVAIVRPTLQITGSGTTHNVFASAGQYSGIINNYAHTDTTNEYIIWFRIYKNNAADDINGFSNLTLTSNGGVRSLVTIQAGAAAANLQEVTDVGNTTTRSVSVGNALQVGFTSPAASNLILLTGSGAGGVPTISTTGIDAAIGLRLTTKGNAPVYVADDIRVGDSVTDYLDVTQGSIFRTLSSNLTIGNVASFTGIQITGGLSIYSTIQAVGLATDVSLSLQPKGAGNVFPIGTTLSASIQPKLAVADGVGSNTLGTGSAGQVLTSGGTTSPYWGAASGGTLAWDIYSVATRYNTAFTPVPAISATFTVPVATVTGTVHNYFRYSAAGAATSIYRFVPTTDSVLTTLSYDSFWSGFTGSALSGLLIQRGNF